MNKGRNWVIKVNGKNAWCRIVNGKVEYGIWNCDNNKNVTWINIKNEKVNEGIINDNGKAEKGKWINKGIDCWNI